MSDCSYTEFINGVLSGHMKTSRKSLSTKGQLYIQMLFTVLQTQNIGVLLFNIVHGRISGRLYESFGVLKPRKKSFLVNKNSEKKTRENSGFTQ